MSSGGKAKSKKAAKAAEEPWLKAELRKLYQGRSKRAVRFRYGLIAFDIVTITFFVVSSVLETTTALLIVDFSIAAVLIADFAARLWIARSRPRFLFNIVTAADIIVIATLLAPAFTENFAFLRVLRALRLLRSYHVLRDLRGRYPFVKRNEELLQSILNLAVFIFVVTALVYVFQVEENPQIGTYLDALYFTVTTLTTTGFGDITLQGPAGRLLAVVIMVLGVALFLRLVQTIFRPQKVHVRCPDCGLNRHDPDAVHCKHCGRVVNIETEGD
ncbi:MAG: potassium channel family protein [Rhodovibrionaceae bacterium]|nr:potassium channel family protein [Rhodovibrionaceae bacterium]